MSNEDDNAALPAALARYKGRSNPAAVAATLSRSGCARHCPLTDFYETYSGPFGSKFIAYTFFDLLDQADNVVTQTMELRSTFGTPERYLVLSDMCGLAVLVYDCGTDAVFNMDLEGSEQKLIAGTLRPTWPSLRAFLEFFFLGVGA